MRFGWTVATAALVTTATACNQGGESPPLTTLQDSASYAVGLNMGSSVREVRDEINLEQLVQGIRDAADARDGRLTPQEAQQVLMAYGQQVQQRQEESRGARADSNKVAGEAYRAENAQREGVQTTASGLQYEMLTEGTGPKPSPGSTVEVHYRGVLIDGREFDSSYGRGEPARFALDQVIPGWSEAVQLMTVGSKYRFVIPPEIGYGEAGSGPDIGPNATLIFEIELLNIVQ